MHVLCCVVLCCLVLWYPRLTNHTFGKAVNVAQITTIIATNVTIKMCILLYFRYHSIARNINPSNCYEHESCTNSGKTDNSAFENQKYFLFVIVFSFSTLFRFSKLTILYFIIVFILFFFTKVLFISHILWFYWLIQHSILFV